jgi:hypothetical protein
LPGVLRPGSRRLREGCRQAAKGAALNQQGDTVMTNRFDIPLCEPLDDFGWDDSDIRDLIRTTPLRFDDEGMPVGYMAEELLGLEATHLGGRSL